MKTPIKHCWSSMMHTPEWNKMRQRNGTGTGNKQALRYAAVSYTHLTLPTNREV